MQAAAVAETASKSFAELQAEDSESAKEDEGAEGSAKESDDEDDQLRKSALDKLENASEDSLLSQASIEGCSLLFFF